MLDGVTSTTVVNGLPEASIPVVVNENGAGALLAELGCRELSGTDDEAGGGIALSEETGVELENNTNVKGDPDASIPVLVIGTVIGID